MMSITHNIFIIKILLKLNGFPVSTISRARLQLFIKVSLTLYPVHFFAIFSLVLRHLLFHPS